MTKFNLGRKKARLYVDSISKASTEKNSTEPYKLKQNNTNEKQNRNGFEDTRHKLEKGDNISTTIQKDTSTKKNRPFFDFRKISFLILVVIIVLSNVFDLGTYVQSVSDSNSEQRKVEEPEIIYFQEFKKIVKGKSGEEIKNLFGNPDKAQDLNGMKIWYYYGSSRKIKIINEDTEKGINMVQIQFFGATAFSINLY